MGVGKYTPNDAIAGDMGWKPAYIRQWPNVFRHWARCSIMEHDRINFKVFKRSIFLSYLPFSTLRGATPHLNFAYALLYFSGILYSK
jgi:hypothetical protein